MEGKKREEKEKVRYKEREMDGGGDGCRVVRCAGGGGGAGAHQDTTIINSIMLKFRPIAPRPANGGRQGAGLPTADKKNSSGLKGRTKRKYVRVCKNSSSRRCRRNKKVATAPSSLDQNREREDGIGSSGITGFNKVVTLQLWPETNDSRDDRSAERKSWCNPDLAMAIGNGEINRESPNHAAVEDAKSGKKDHRVIMINLEEEEEEQEQVVVMESWVTVECVAETLACMGTLRGGVGCTDVERVKILEGDTCPGFISDGSNRVRWVNGAYKRMLMVKYYDHHGNREEQEKNNNKNNINNHEVMVWLAIKEKLQEYLNYQTAFTCWVRLHYTWQQKHKCLVQMVPCDVWRMDFGGFAWRLDVEAALGLGR